MLESSPEELSPPLVENLHFTCPNCEAPMLERGCKLLCQRCGYFMGCSDFV